ncbi:MAG: glycogen synthase [Candidatus Anammoximicrobium sp.]|nr:glycogen synthase [Candidatus Anammoximicrobium sp.]
MVDPELSQSVSGWSHDPWALQALFGETDGARLASGRRAVQKDRRTIVLCAYENFFARAGGLFQVARLLPKTLQQHGERVLVLSPFHAALATAPARPSESPGAAPSPLQPCRETGETSVRFANTRVPLKLWEHTLDGVRWVLFEAPDYFRARGGPKGKIPYDYTGPDHPQAPSRLDVDSLFASAAVPSVLAALGLTEDLVIHAQDWQLAATALTVKQALLDNVLHSASVVLSSHNPYDRVLPPGKLGLITGRVHERFWPTLRQTPRRDGTLPVRRDTFYECMLPLLDAPVATVSKSFARELTVHPVQTAFFASHLQDVFRRQGVVGVDNGLFLDANAGPFSAAAVDEARRGNVAAILREKEDKRQVLLQHFAGYLQESARGELNAGPGRSLADLPPEVPVFMMFGRMDPGQKGFDVLARAVERIEPGRAKFIFALESPGGVERWVADLAQLASERQGDVTFIPDRMTDGYFDTMAGATYCVMPSLYEPFGAATEPYVQGTPVVACATGGLLQQVRNYRHDRASATGLLYDADLSSLAPADVAAHWRELLVAADPETRQANPVYRQLVEGLTDALLEAIAIFSQRPECYGRLLANLYGQALAFSWDHAADEYRLLYDCATR